ncbi:MAG: 16S rRNA (guanine(966)-N(2))-methyltransferase RsmD [Janthinobacterium lividum]
MRSPTTPNRRPTAAARGAGARRPPSEVRIIAGLWRRTRLPVLDAEGLRPTSDRVRETLFNWLGQRLDGYRCLDLFAGSGALGFEAASRGAAQVVLVERNRRVAAQLLDNRTRLAALNLEVVEGDALRIAASWPAGSIDLLFLDPPFGSDLLAAALPLADRLMTANGVIYVESSLPLIESNGAAGLSAVEAQAVGGAPAASLLACPRGWRIDRQGKAGAVCFHLLRRENRE